VRTGRVLLAVDLSYQTYRAASVHSTLTSVEDVFTGGVFGFMVSVAKIIRECGATEVVVTKDVKPYKRSEVYPEYKQLRRDSANEELRDKYLASVPLVLEMLETVGIPTMEALGFESDDCIAHIVSQHRHRYRTIYAASNDSDLYQLFYCPWFKVWRKDTESVMDYWRLREETGLDPEEFVLASALMGTHNDIAGIPRVGPKTAYKAVLNPGLLRPYYQRYNDLIQRNLGLIRLPHAAFPGEMPVPKRTRSFDVRALYRWCAKYDITATQSMVTAFEQVAP